MSAKKFAWERAWTLVSVLLLLLITVFTVGCFKGEANLTIRADGSAALKTRLLGTDLLKESIVEATNEIRKKDSSAQVKEISEDGKTGFEITSEYPDMKTLAEKGGDLFTRRVTARRRAFGKRRHGSTTPTHSISTQALVKQEMMPTATIRRRPL